MKDFVAGTDTVTLDVELPVAVSNGDAYTIYKGCDQTWDTCGQTYNYGPSADNQANYGGQIHISGLEAGGDAAAAAANPPIQWRPLGRGDA